MPNGIGNCTYSIRIAEVAFFFQFFNLFITQPTAKKYTILPQKSKLHDLTIFYSLDFFLIYTTLPQKNCMTLPQKKLHGLTFFLYTGYIFHVGDGGLATKQQARWCEVGKDHM